MFTHDASLFVDDEDGFAAYRREEVQEEAATEVVSGSRLRSHSVSYINMQL